MKPEKALAKKITRPDASAKIILTALQKAANPLTKKLEKIIIIDQESYDNAALNMSVLKQLGKQAAEKEKSLLDPLKLVEAGIRELFSPFKKEVAQWEVDIKLAMGIFRAEQDKKKLMVLEAVDSGAIKKVSTAVQKISALTVSKNANSRVSKVWRLTLIDANKVPRKYMVPDESLIKEDLKAGLSVAGVKWEQIDSIAI